MPDIVLISTDLMFSSRAQGAARQGSHTLAVRDASFLPKPEDDLPRLVAIDLQTPRIDLESLLAAVRAAGEIQVIAYGPHVQAGKLSAARAAGCDAVYTRGQFEGEMEAIFVRHLACN